MSATFDAAEFCEVCGVQFSRWELDDPGLLHDGPDGGLVHPSCCAGCVEGTA